MMGILPIRVDDDGEPRRLLPYVWEVRDWWDKHILPLPHHDVVMEGWDEEGEDRHHWGSEWWKEHHIRVLNAYPFRNWLHHTLPIFLTVWGRRLFKDPYWKLQHRFNPKHRYNTLHTGLPPGYYDPDTRFLYAIMEEVCAYVALTKDTVDWNYDEDHRIKWKTLTDAAEWWVRYKNFREHEFDDVRYERAEKAQTRDEKHAYYLALNAEEEEWERQADAHLLAIMKIRRTIWYP